MIGGYRYSMGRDPAPKVSKHEACRNCLLQYRFWVAQRFSVAITGLFSVRLLAAGVNMPGGEGLQLPV
jgi:hypothetical protein